MKEKLSAWTIRKKFPNPVPFDSLEQDKSKESYCVGGALCLFRAKQDSPELASMNFPEDSELASVIHTVNPSLSYLEADSYAEDILHYNDEGDIETAWKVLHYALSTEEYINVTK